MRNRTSGGVGGRGPRGPLLPDCSTPYPTNASGGPERDAESGRLTSTTCQALPNLARPGSVNRKVEPTPFSLSTITFPPWASTNVFTIARPKPVPPSLSKSVSSLSKILSSRSLGIPAPLSLTQHSMPPSALVSLAPMTTSPRGVYVIAFVTRF